MWKGTKMNRTLKYAIGLAALACAAQVAAQVTFYEREGFQGRSFTADRPIGNFDRYGFNDRASSVIVVGKPWEVCEDARFSGRCVVLRPGHYPSLASMGLNNSVSSVRMLERAARIDDTRYAPAPLPVYDARRRPGEQLYSARVTDVRAVIGSSGQRCWVERQEVPAERSSANVPGAIAGAVIGGILGHQVGGGTGRDVATVGGVVAGAAIGANVGRDNRPAELRDVQRCASMPGQARPDYWDVSYDFRGVEHRVQTTTPPGPTITVNERGEPRG